jgi:hypothetical protein
MLIAPRRSEGGLDLLRVVPSRMRILAQLPPLDGEVRPDGTGLAARCARIRCHYADPSEPGLARELNPCGQRLGAVAPLLLPWVARGKQPTGEEPAWPSLVWLALPPSPTWDHPSTWDPHSLCSPQRARCDGHHIKAFSPGLAGAPTNHL